VNQSKNVTNRIEEIKQAYFPSVAIMTHAMKLCSTYGDHIVPSITIDGTIIMCEEKDNSLSVSTRWWNTDDYKYVVIGAKLYPPNNDSSSSRAPYWSTIPVSLDFTVEGENNKTRFSRGRNLANCATMALGDCVSTSSGSLARSLLPPYSTLSNMSRRRTTGYSSSIDCVPPSIRQHIICGPWECTTIPKVIWLPSLRT
jgi:hypothetical protein